MGKEVMSKIKITMKITNDDGTGTAIITKQKFTIPSASNIRYEKVGVMGNFDGSKEEDVTMLLTFKKTIDKEGTIPGIRKPR